MNSTRCTILFLLATYVAGCAAGSRAYKPMDWEAPLLQKADRSIFPSDVKAEPDKYQCQLFHWVGVVKDFSVTVEEGTVVYSILLNQKYYDYIEDYSIQTEIMFISPEGEGKFVCLGVAEGISAEELQKDLSTRATRGDLGFYYGVLAEVRDELPILERVAIRFIPEEY
jgi:hypothetical protein